MRAAEDVSLRRLVSFGLSPQLKSHFDQIFSAPFLVELLLAELGAGPGQDVLVRLHFDGAFQVQSGGARHGRQPAGSRVRRTNLAE